MQTFLAENKLMILGYLHFVNKQAFPRSSLVAYAEDGLELIFQTMTIGRKYNDLQFCGRVSVVISSGLKTMQYEGNAQMIADVDWAQRVMLLKNGPCDRRFIFDPRARWFLIRPWWVKLSDYTREPIIKEWYA